MLDARPLLSTKADAPRYVETDVHRVALRALRRGRNVFVEGAAGSGKTSLLRMLELQLRDEGVPVAFVSLAQARTVVDAAAAVHRTAAGLGWIVDDEALRSDARRAVDDPFAPNRLIEVLIDAPAEAVVLIDDPDPDVAHDLFGRMRDMLWQLPLAWLVAAREDVAATLLMPPADAFFDHRLRLEPLGAEQRRELLVRRLGAKIGPDLRELAATGPGNPRRLIAAARDVTENQRRPQDVIASTEERRAAARDAAGRPGEMLVTVLEHLGPVSAGDELLLHEMGWTRPRAVEVLRRLEDAGVVEAQRARPDGPGQPRKLYRLVETGREWQ